MPITIFTSITANYLPKARVLARSVKQHNPEVRFVLLLAETKPLSVSADLTAFDKVVLLEDLAIPDLPAWLFKHSVVELCTAIKGFYLERCLAEKNCDAVIYLDPDMVVFSPLTSVFLALEKASILLTPHLLEAEETEADIITNELSALKHGVYNLGFVAVKNSGEGRRFASWWRTRLAQFCYADIPNGMFTDQRWVDLAPAFFEDLAIIRNVGCNVATWNLSRRHIEGTIEQGFTVNGHPLVFYHFSGFDSGAQLGMLKRYAGTMPAAFRLREWYIAACKEQETEPPITSWQYNYFSDGTPITPKVREFYRNHQEVAVRFPDPFAAGEGSFLQWYQCYGDDYTLSSMPDFSTNPLAHFLNNGWRQGLLTHPAFDSQFYIESNPDVKMHNYNPLLHYQEKGGKERRNPHPFFDTRFFWRRYGKEISNSTLTPLEYMLMHPEHALSLKCYNEKECGRQMARLQAHLTPDRPVILMVNHNQGGGTEKYVYDLAKQLAHKAHFLLLYPVTEHVVRLADFPGGAGVDLLFDIATQMDVLLSTLRQLQVSRLHVHHLIGNEGYLQSLIAALHVPYDITLHDYYLLSQQPHLTDAQGRFSGEPVAYTEWQQKNHWLLAGASRVIAPSTDIAIRHQRFFPDIQYKVAPHPSDRPYNPSNVKVPILANDAPLKIAVLGLVSPNKGSAILDKTAQLAQAMGFKITFDLIGTTLTPLTVAPASNLRVHGAYEEEELPGLIQSVNPHLIWFPALCPESFSYTLSSAMEASLPVVATAIGAFPERIAGRPWSWVMPWDMTAGQWLSFFATIREQHFLPGIAPEPPTGKGYEGDVMFYEEQYVLTT